MSQERAHIISQIRKSIFAIVRAHDGYRGNTPLIYQASKKIDHLLRARAKRTMQQFLSKRRCITFMDKVELRTFQAEYKPITVTYNSGVYGNHLRRKTDARPCCPLSAAP